VRSIEPVGALDGITVLDLGLLVQGPQAAAMLGDMGADVVKVELPGFGDQSRWIPISMQDFRAPFLIACNRGKRSMTCDLRTPAGREVLLRLAERTDVIISNFKPGTLDQWGLGYAEVAERNPRIVYATGSAFGPVGPDSEREGADLAGQASGGLISTTGAGDEAPTPVGVTISDHIASQNLVAGVLAALFARERTGRGQRVDVSLLGGQIWAQASELTATMLSGSQPDRSNRGHGLIPAVYGILPTADGWIAMVGAPGHLRTAFYDAIGRPDLRDDPRFVSPLLGRADKAALFDTLAETFRTKDTATWCTILSAAGQRFAPVRGYEQIIADPHVMENGYLTRSDHTDGPATAIGTPIRMSETPLEPGVVVPELGQHTEEVLLEHGFDWDEITLLRDANAI
jgi:crotonobetainyl-CoA:carnitine CoA-transferase CaiB-like acyl-CoA transferase